MKYFLDTEFHEYKKQPTVCGVKVGKPIDTIELISIGIVSEDITDYRDYMPDAVSGKMSKEKKLFPPHSREYYAICKDFDLKAAWNSYQWKTEMRDVGMSKVKVKEYWLRENVLRPIFNELVHKFAGEEYKSIQSCYSIGYNPPIRFTYKSIKRLINKYGKTKEQIAKEIHSFIYKDYLDGTGLSYPEAFCYRHPDYDPEFYAYYADYDWVVFCGLFGRMIDLPKGFPMYCFDLKQLMDEIVKRPIIGGSIFGYKTIEDLKNDSNYPKQTNEHNALADAKWNKELYKFLQLL